eukprot:47301-Eustigmatos_ZCMA.PRE.1
MRAWRRAWRTQHSDVCSLGLRVRVRHTRMCSAWRGVYSSVNGVVRPRARMCAWNEWVVG